MLCHTLKLRELLVNLVVRPFNLDHYITDTALLHWIKLSSFSISHTYPLKAFKKHKDHTINIEPGQPAPQQFYITGCLLNSLISLKLIEHSSTFRTSLLPTFSRVRAHITSLPTIVHYRYKPPVSDIPTPAECQLA